MELRSCSHLHYIQVIKGGLATKVLNVYRGRPALKFKNVKDLYEIEDTKNSDPFPVLSPKLEFVELPVGCDGANTESLRGYTGERTTIKDGEISECNSKGCDDGESELDDFNFGNMTLKQIKDRCKEKKAKCSGYVSCNKEKVETCSFRKQNHRNSQSEEDEYDIMEPLSCWKSRILNKKKTKRKCRKESVSVSSENALSIVKFEETLSDQDVFQINENFPAPIKVEVPEPAYSDSKAMIITLADSFNWNKPVTSSRVVPCEEPESASDYDLESGTSMVAFEEPEATNDNALQAGISTVACEEPETENDYELETGTSMLASEELDTVKDFVLETGRSVISGEELTTNACGFSQIPAFFCNELQCCVVNEESYEYVECEDRKSTFDVQVSGGKIMMEGIAELIDHQFKDLSLSKAKKEDSVTDQHPKNDSPETLSPSENHSPVMSYDPQGFTCAHEKSWKTTSDSQVQVPDVTINNSPQCMEHSERNSSCPPEDETKDDTLHVEASVISSPVRDFSSLCSSKLQSGPKSCLLSVVDHSPAPEKKQLPSPACADAATNTSAVIRSCVDEPVTSAKFEECHHSKLQHAPEKLFSTRMAISPSSQKRLRNALESSELDDEQYYKHARKLCYRKQTENKVGRFEGANQIKRTEVIVSPKEAVRKAKIGNHGFHHNDTLKVPHPSRAVQNFSTGCTSVRSCSESAILFSQQQMHDIESVASKLAKELQSMKDIVEETLQSKVYPATSSKYSADEVRIAVQSATRVEESARRSLSIMARDCNRFCKIMKLTEKGNSASQNAVCKKRKIIFADEAGGKLCEVKTFEDGMSSFMQPEREKTGTVD